MGFRGRVTSREGIVISATKILRTARYFVRARVGERAWARAGARAWGVCLCVRARAGVRARARVRACGCVSMYADIPVPTPVPVLCLVLTSPRARRVPVEKGVPG